MSDDAVTSHLRGENAQLLGVIDKGAKAWLSLEPGIAWEGDLGDAMIAAVSEIRRLRCRLGSVVAENVDGVIAALHTEAAAESELPQEEAGDGA